MGNFTWEICQKNIQNEGWFETTCKLKKHKDMSVQNTTMPVETKIGDGTLVSLISDAQKILGLIMCYPLEIRSAILKYNSTENNENLLNQINPIYKTLAKNNDSEAFYSGFYSSIVAYPSSYFINLPHPCCSLLATKLAHKVFALYKRPTHKETTQPPVITEKEMDDLQYLAGYVVIKKFIQKIQSGKDYNKI